MLAVIRIMIYVCVSYRIYVSFELDTQYTQTSINCQLNVSLPSIIDAVFTMLIILPFAAELFFLGKENMQFIVVNCCDVPFKKCIHPSFSQKKKREKKMAGFF